MTPAAVQTRRCSSASWSWMPVQRQGDAHEGHRLAGLARCAGPRTSSVDATVSLQRVAVPNSRVARLPAPPAGRRGCSMRAGSSSESASTRPSRSIKVMRSRRSAGPGLDALGSSGNLCGRPVANHFPTRTALRAQALLDLLQLVPLDALDDDDAQQADGGQHQHAERPNSRQNMRERHMRKTRRQGDKETRMTISR